MHNKMITIRKIFVLVPLNLQTISVVMLNIYIYIYKAKSFNALPLYQKYASFLSLYIVSNTLFISKLPVWPI